jgi:SAM-dependent methyltransferase
MPIDADWFTDEEMWEATFPFMFPPASWDEAAEQAAGALRLAGAEPGAAVADLACGAGRHAIPMAQAGMRVTGVDRTRFLLGEARRRAAEADAAVEWVESDLRDFVRPGAFDVAVNLFTSFGYFEDAADNLRVLRNAHASLRPGGALVMEMMGKEVLARAYRPADVDEHPEHGMLVMRRRVVDGWSRAENEWTLVNGGRTRRFALRHWLYSGRELHDLLAAAGFGSVRILGSLDGAPYDPKAPRLVAVARRE